MQSPPLTFLPYLLLRLLLLPNLYLSTDLTPCFGRPCFLYPCFLYPCFHYSVLVYHSQFIRVYSLNRLQEYFHPWLLAATVLITLTLFIFLLTLFTFQSEYPRRHLPQLVLNRILVSIILRYWRLQFHSQLVFLDRHEWPNRKCQLSSHHGLVWTTDIVYVDEWRAIAQWFYSTKNISFFYLKIQINFDS